MFIVKFTNALFSTSIGASLSLDFRKQCKLLGRGKKGLKRKCKCSQLCRDKVTKKKIIVEYHSFSLKANLMQSKAHTHTQVDEKVRLHSNVHTIMP